MRGGKIRNDLFEAMIAAFDAPMTRVQNRAGVSSHCSWPTSTTAQAVWGEYFEDDVAESSRQRRAGPGGMGLAVKGLNVNGSDRPFSRELLGRRALSR